MDEKTQVMELVSKEIREKTTKNILSQRAKNIEVIVEYLIREGSTLTPEQRQKKLGDILVLADDLDSRIFFDIEIQEKDKEWENQRHLLKCAVMQGGEVKVPLLSDYNDAACALRDRGIFKLVHGENEEIYSYWTFVKQV